MTTARFFFGASLWALLIVDMYCGPVNRGFNPGASFSGSSMYPRLGSNQGEPSSQYSPGLGPEGAYPELAASAGSGSSTRLLQPSGSAGAEDPAAPAESGAGFQSGPQDSFGFIAPPPPVYQAGELAEFERSIEAGDYDQETLKQGHRPPSYYQSPYAYTPLDESLEGYASPSLPYDYQIPPPYYNYRFLTGQYPPGTVGYFSGSSDQGTNNYEELHYVSEYLPKAVPSQPKNAPQAPANGGSKRGGAAKRPIYSGRPARHPIRQAGGYGSKANAVKHG